MIYRIHVEFRFGDDNESPVLMRSEVIASAASATDAISKVEDHLRRRPPIKGAYAKVTGLSEAPEIIAAIG